MTTLPPTVLTQLAIISAKLREHTIGSDRPTDTANNSPIWTKGTIAQ